jgi:hypothetical protein
MQGRPDLHRALNAWLATHHGVIGRSQLRMLGFSEGAIKHLVESNRLTRSMPTVYRSPAHPTSPLQTMVAICLRYPDAVVSATTAGQLLGIRRMSDRRIHVLMPHERRPALEVPGVILHRSRRIDRIDVIDRRRDGVRHTGPARTLLDAASIIDDEALESAIDHALREGMCSLPMLLRTDERLYHPRRPGSTRFRRVVRSRPDWRNAARSDLEVRFRRAVVARGLPEPLVNTPLELPSGETIEVDLLWRDERVIGEVDHLFWHDDPAPRRRDRRRDRRTAALGWLTVRFDEYDIDVGLEPALDELAGVLADRRGSAGSAA